MKAYSVAAYHDVRTVNRQCSSLEHHTKGPPRYLVVVEENSSGTSARDE
jgi:hypothetical protein